MSDFGAADLTPAEAPTLMEWVHTQGTNLPSRTASPLVEDVLRLDADDDLVPVSFALGDAVRPEPVRPLEDEDYATAADF